MKDQEQILNNIITELNTPEPSIKKTVQQLLELEKETKSRCVHCRHEKYT